MTDLIERHELIKRMVDEQAEDDGIWFDAQYITEAYLQHQLRRLHRVIETGEYEVSENP